MYHPDVNMRDTHSKIRDCIKQRKLEWKGSLKSTRNMDKVSHKVFKTTVKDILQYLTPFGESSSEVSHIILKPRNFYVATKLSDDIKKPWINETRN